MARGVVIRVLALAVAAGVGGCAAAGEARAFDWRRLGTYDANEDLRPINDAFEAAVLEELSAMDLSVPKYFLDRPELNAPEYNTPIPPVGR